MAKRWNRAGIGAAALAAGVSLLMIGAPISSAATAGIVFTHPYNSWGAYTQLSTESAGCGVEKTLSPVKWTKTSGLFHASAKTAAKNCKNPVTGNIGFWYTYLTLERYVSFPANGSANLNVSWKVVSNATWSVTPYTSCALNYAVYYSTCFASADVFVYSYAYLEDESNFSYFYFGSTSPSLVSHYASVQNYSQNYCYSGTCYHYGGNFSSGNLSGSVSGPSLGYINLTAGTVVAGDTYLIVISLLAEVISEVQVTNAVSTGAAAASAQLNMGTLGNNAFLAKVALT